MPVCWWVGIPLVVGVVNRPTQEATSLVGLTEQGQCHVGAIAGMDLREWINHVADVASATPEVHHRASDQAAQGTLNPGVARGPSRVSRATPVDLTEPVQRHQRALRRCSA